MFFSVAGPSFLQPACTGSRATGREIVQRHVWALVVVKLDCLAYGLPNLAYGTTSDILEQFVLDGAVLALGHCVVLGVSALGHADPDAGIDQQGRIGCTNVLHAPVRVVDEARGLFVSQGAEGLREAFHAAPGFQRLAHVPADDLLCVAVRDHRQVAEGVFVIAEPYRDIGDVRHPELVLAFGDEFPGQVGICRQPVGGVRRAGTAPGLPHVQAVLCDDGFHLVTADHMLIAAAEALKVHVVQFRATDAWVKAACLLDELDDHLFLQPLLA